MTSARSHRLARYSLPDVPQPEDTVGFCVQVPNDLKHIVAFKSQIRALARAYTWADDDDHTALLCAAAWQPTADAIDIDNPNCTGGAPCILCIGGTFADLDYGFVPDIAAPCSPSWVNGTGWESCTDGGTGKESLEVMRVFDSQTFIRSAKFTMRSQIGQSYDFHINFYLGGSNVYTFDDTVLAGGGTTFSENINQQADRVTIHIEETVASAGSHDVLDDWQLCYTGDFPLAGSTGWTKVFDFTVDDGSPYVESVLYGHWTAGVGYEGAIAGDPNNVQIRVWIGGTQFTSTGMDLQWSVVNSNGGGSGVCRAFTGNMGGTVVMNEGAILADHGSGSHIVSSAGPTASPVSILIGDDAHAAGGGSIVLEKLTIHGQGFNPFA